MDHSAGFLFLVKKHPILLILTRSKNPKVSFYYIIIYSLLPKQPLCKNEHNNVNKINLSAWSEKKGSFPDPLLN